jgi:hypothetical protein
VHYIRRTSEDQRVVPYNPLVSLIWKARTNLQVCTDSCLIGYLVKYVAKMEPKYAASPDMDPKKKEYLQSPVGRHIHGRVMSAAEVAARLLKIPHAAGTQSVLFIDTEMSGKRSRSFRSIFDLGMMDKDSTDVFREGKIEHYEARPAGEEFDSLTMPMYFRRYAILPVARQKAGKTYVTDKHGSVIRKRTKQVVPRWHWKTPHKDGEAFYYQQILLTQPFRDREELLSAENSGKTYREECYLRKIVVKDNEQSLLQQLAFNHRFSSKSIKRMLAEYQEHQLVGPLRELLSLFFTSAAVVVAIILEYLSEESDLLSTSKLPPLADMDENAVRDLVGASIVTNEPKYKNTRPIAQLTRSQRTAHYHVVKQVCCCAHVIFEIVLLV